jgi:predicted negative regulator of RcsB-dependent stress response
MDLGDAYAAIGKRDDAREMYRTALTKPHSDWQGSAMEESIRQMDAIIGKN